MEKVKQELVGKVVSDACDKTITIEIETYRKHPIYKKRVIKTKKYKVHDEKNEAKVGDIVRVVSSKPISKTKRYVLDKVVEKAEIL
jgi:small subunit ribosomal protein S17